MSIWDTAARALGLRPAKGPQNAAVVTTSWKAGNFWDDVVSQAGGLVVPTTQTARQLSAVTACVNLIAGAISSMPMHIYRQDVTGERDRIPAEDLWWVLNEEMSPRWSAADGWEYLVSSLLLEGDAFAEILRDPAGRIMGLMPLSCDRVRVLPSPDGLRLVYVIDPDPAVSSGAGPRRVLDQDDVLHVATNFNGVRGLSPLRHELRMAGSVAIATQDYSARFFANSARPDLVLATDQTLSAESVENLRAQLEDRHGGSANAHKPMLLTGGLKPTVINMPLEDLQLLQTRQFQIEEIARIYGVPPFMIGHTEKTSSWGSGVESMGTGFVRYTLRRHLNKFQNEINRKFFRTASRVAEFDTTELERADTKSLFESFRIAVGRAGEPGIMTVEEVRSRLNLKRTPDGVLFNGATNAQPAPPAGS